MARRKKHEEHANHERWLVSYADFITLLFAFFVVMFSVSQVDSKKVGRFTQSFNEAIEWGAFGSQGRGVLPGVEAPIEWKVSPPSASPGAGLRPLAPSLEKLRGRIRERTSATSRLRSLSLDEVRGELVLRFPEALMFDAGEATLQQEGKDVLNEVADLLRDQEVLVRIEGHTDSKPIRTSRFNSNWDLSTARAVAVVAFLIEHGKLDAPQLSAAGYSEYHPLADNRTEEGRAKNRRVDIFLVAPIEPPAGAKSNKATEPKGDGM